MNTIYLELSAETHENFLKLKKAIEEMAGENVTDDQVIDFLIRSMMSSVELPEEEHEGCGCCCGGHDEEREQHHYHEHHHHDNHHHSEKTCQCGEDCKCNNEGHCDCKGHCH